MPGKHRKLKKRSSGAKRSQKSKVSTAASDAKASKYSAKAHKNSAKSNKDAKKASKNAVKAPKDAEKTHKDSANEFVIRVPKVRNQRCLMRFNNNLNVDFNKWRNVKMSRENNKSEDMIEEQKPTFGAGTSFNSKKTVPDKYRPEAQPWLLQVDGKMGKKFKGFRSGEVGANSAYYVFTQAPDGRFNAYPINEWYTFMPIERFTPLTTEEVEQEFSRREKTINFFNLMLRRRCRGEQEEGDADAAKLSQFASDKDDLKLKITDEVEWMDSADESDTDDEEHEKKMEQKDGLEGDENEGKEAKTKAKAKAKAKAKKAVDMKTFFEAFEESDDGDEEGREREYISSSSEDEPDPEEKVSKDLKSVAEEEALLKLLNSDDEEDDEESQTQIYERQESSEDEACKNPDVVEDESSSGSDIEPTDSTDSETDLSNGPPRKRVTFNEKEKRLLNAANKSPSSVAGTTKDAKKRNVAVMNSLDLAKPATTPPKRKEDSAQVEQSAIVLCKIDQYGVSEEAVIRYLKRKPMAATELLSRFRTKANTSDSKMRLVETMTKILKKINPVKTTIQGTLYFSIK
ncbi:general transcription factor IIF subunit 1-like [Drosophila subobscura]|uniref:general transcription factor IIF subunit 1-like n=1 Tax=Drosophila subobscura TaxID=7241 RepID=UPI00155ABBD6|nr:general transcription factor IIF subunit 1-like [Drosophila subobscura]